jgi:hypothetical protein
VSDFRVCEVENLANRQVKRSASDHRRDPVEPVARDVDDKIRRAHVSRPEIILVWRARDGDDDPYSVSPDSMSLSKPNPIEPPWYEIRMPGGGGGGGTARCPPIPIIDPLGQLQYLRQSPARIA